MIKRIFKFSFVGLMGIAVGLGVITFAVEILKIEPRSAWYLSSFFAILNNFLFNNYYTWAERRAKKTKKLSQKIILYYLFSVLSILLNYLIFNYLIHHGFHYFIALSAAIAVCAVVNFLLNELVVWRKTRN